MYVISALIANSLKAKMLFVKGTKHCQGLVHAPPPVETKMSLWNWMVHCQGLVLPSKQTPHVTVRDWRRTGNILMLARSPPKKEDAGMLPAMLNPSGPLRVSLAGPSGACYRTEALEFLALLAFCVAGHCRIVLLPSFGWLLYLVLLRGITGT